jgi:hypothetical protein
LPSERERERRREREIDGGKRVEKEVEDEKQGA